MTQYDEAKNKDNIKKHGIAFDGVADFDWDTALTTIDDRKDYGEIRHISYGLVGDRLHILVWTPRDGQIRPISFRKANIRERRFYDSQI